MKKVKLVEDDYPLVKQRRKKERISVTRKKELDMIAKDVYDRAMDSIEIDYGEDAYVSHKIRMLYFNAETYRYSFNHAEYKYVLEKADKG